MKYTKEVLQAAVKESLSVAQVLRRLGLTEAGGTHAHISRRIKAFRIDTSHFLGTRANSGAIHKGGARRQTWQEVLVLRAGPTRQKSHLLRRALLESGRDYQCQGPGCTVRGEWLGKTIILHVNHKNGDWLDDRPENLELLCPNCHSQTGDYCGSKGFAELTSRARWFRHYRKKKKGLVAELADAYGLGP
jgi:5-methylcytosine-specific restriction endonuclease McrA